MSWHTVIDVLRNSVLITGLVLIMMLMIEYFNIHSHGRWFSLIKDSKIKQIFLGSLLGLVPGCIGGFATVSLYTHRLLSLGALVAMMISSSGDEAFVIMAMIPREGFILFGMLFVISIITGVIVDYVIYRNPQKDLCPDDFEIHDTPEGEDRRIPSIFSFGLICLLTFPMVLISCCKPFTGKYAACTGIRILSAQENAFIVIMPSEGIQSIRI